MTKYSTGTSAPSWGIAFTRRSVRWLCGPRVIIWSWT